MVLGALNVLQGRLQASGAAADALEPFAAAVDLLLPDFMTRERRTFAMFMAEPLVWRLTVLSLPLLSACVVYGLWNLLNA
ncbi:hypothetical protein HA45_23030 [Pantoea rodasii]|nr:hypothetical protein [Pantoea rodasii]ORM58666.1 hypothetical protein HA45_23030 [Pantoea rodasii]